MAKTIVNEILESYLDLEYTIPEIIERFHQYQQQYSSYSKLYLEKDYDGESNILTLRGSRLETDEEEVARLEHEENTNLYRLSAKEKQLEALAKELGKTIV